MSMEFFKFLKKFSYLCGCVYFFGLSSAQTIKREAVVPENERHNQGSYFFYQSPEYPRDCGEVRNQCLLPTDSGVYFIKPDGYPEPFEVYCSNDTDSGGWMVIHRRLDGSIGFNRNWEDYKRGFGFLSSEFWLGNERLAFVTNQNAYQLRVDILLSNGKSFFVEHDLFRISDEWGNYSLVPLGDFRGDSGSAITPCPQNMVYPGCTCEASCDNPVVGPDCTTNCDQNKTCVCQEGFLRKDGACVNSTECGCFISEESRFILSGQTYVNANCTQNCTCNGHQLSCEDHECNSHATCTVSEEGVRQCICDEGYKGDGITCNIEFRDCNDVRDANYTQSGVYTIYPSEWPLSPFEVFCNMTIDGGGWTVFQRRKNGATDFFRDWLSYSSGFGDNEEEFWLGNEKLHYLTKQGTYELRVDFVSSSNAAKYAKYTSFTIDSKENKYRVTDIGTFSGNGYNGMSDVEDQAFSTRDQDNDGTDYNCAQAHKGGWWYGGYYYDASSPYCHRTPVGGRHKEFTYSNPNGEYNGGNGQGIYWYYNNYCHIKYMEMKLRRKSLH